MAYQIGIYLMSTLLQASYPILTNCRIRNNQYQLHVLQSVESHVITSLITVQYKYLLPKL